MSEARLNALEQQVRQLNNQLAALMKHLRVPTKHEPEPRVYDTTPACLVDTEPGDLWLNRVGMTDCKIELGRMVGDVPLPWE